MSVMSFDTTRAIQAVTPMKAVCEHNDSAGEKDLFASVFKQMKAEACTDAQPVDNPTGGCQGDGTNTGNHRAPDGRSERRSLETRVEDADPGKGSHDRRENANACNNCAIQTAQPGSTSVSTGSGHGSGAVMGALSEDMKKLVRVLRNSAVSKRRNVFMTLNLEDAGEVILDVRIEGKKVFIEASTSSRRAGAALTVSVGLLKEALGECDLELADISIRTTRAAISPKRRGNANDGWSARAVAR